MVIGWIIFYSNRHSKQGKHDRIFYSSLTLPLLTFLPYMCGSLDGPLPLSLFPLSLIYLNLTLSFLGPWHLVYHEKAGYLIVCVCFCFVLGFMSLSRSGVKDRTTDCGPSETCSQLERNREENMWSYVLIQRFLFMHITYFKFKYVVYIVYE